MEAQYTRYSIAIYGPTRAAHQVLESLLLKSQNNTRKLTIKFATKAPQGAGIFQLLSAIPPNFSNSIYRALTLITCCTVCSECRWIKNYSTVSSKINNTNTL